MNLIDGSEADAATKIQMVVSQQVSQFQFGDFGVVCLLDRWEIWSVRFESRARILSMASRVFEILDHTPVTAFGFNFHFHRQTQLASVGNLVGVAIQRLPIGVDAIPNASGQLSLTSGTEKRQTSIVVAQSQLGPSLVFFSANYQYPIRVAARPSHFDLTPMLAEGFEPDFAESSEMANSVVTGLPKLGGAYGSRTY